VISLLCIMVDEARFLGGFSEIGTWGEIVL